MAENDHPKYVLPKKIAIELIPDGATLITLVHVDEQKYEFTFTREEVRGLANFLLDSIEKY